MVCGSYFKGLDLSKSEIIKGIPGIWGALDRHPHGHFKKLVYYATDYQLNFHFPAHHLSPLVTI